MARLFLVPGLLGGFLFLFWLWALVDVILTDSMLVRNMQKGTWLFLVILVPTVGAVAWVFFGRPEKAALAPGGQLPYSANPYRSTSQGGSGSGQWSGAAEDSPGWSGPRSTPSRPAGIEDGESLAVRQRKLMEKEAELARRESELEARERPADPGHADGGPNSHDDLPDQA
ncbi:MAG: PLD nuclease N-terminal domain-containing protein [Actinomycetota bacterium]